MDVIDITGVLNIDPYSVLLYAAIVTGLGVASSARRPLIEFCVLLISPLSQVDPALRRQS